MLVPIDDNTVAAENEADLREAVGNNIINYVYLANSITITGGVTIYAGKTSLVIDGEYPIGSGRRNEFTDVNSTSYYDTFGIGSTSSIAITMRNMVIHGRNFFGVPYIVETIAGITNTDNVSVRYENVTYTGPQMTYNCNGFTSYRDCDITIEQTGVSQSQEVGEVNRIELGGTVNILHRSNMDNRAVFWFRGATATMSLTVLTGAEVTVNSTDSYFMYNMETVWGTPYPVPYVIQTGGSLDLTVSRGLSFDSRNQLSSFRVGENARFRYIQTGSNGTAASLYLNGALTVGAGARFYMQAANGTQPLIQFTSGNGRSLAVEDPFSFVLYCANNPAFQSLATTQFSLRGGQVNTWTTPRTPVTAAGGFDDTPGSKWHKANYATPVAITGTFTQTATTATGNLEQADEPYPPLSDLRLYQARVLSVGDWPVEVDPVADDARPITGRTEPGANMRASYTIDEVRHTVSGVAGENGVFSLETTEEEPPAIPAETVVVIGSNIPFLIKEINVTVIEAGDLLITSAPEVIGFRVLPVSTDPVLLPRAEARVPVVIEDTRAEISRWELSLSVTEPLQTEFGDILPDAVVFQAAAGGQPVTLGAVPTVVYTGGPGAGETRVFWPEDEGILIRVTSPMRMGIRYFTQVVWEVSAIDGE